MKEKTWVILAITLILTTITALFLWWWIDEVRTNRELKQGRTIFISEDGAWLEGKDIIEDGLTFIGCTWITDPNDWITDPNELIVWE